MAVEWQKNKYWDSEQVCAFLGIKRNNLGQIASRMRKGHETAKHLDDGKCICLLPDHKGHGLNRYRADLVRKYDLYRKGEPSELNTIISNARKAEKLPKMGKKKSSGRPSTKIRGTN